MQRSHRNRWTTAITVLAVLSLGLGFVLAQTASTQGEQSEEGCTETGEHEVCTDDQGLRYVIDPSLLAAGGPSRDGIPSIDHPQFVSAAEATDWLADDEIVVALVYKGVERVYPVRILVWHEIVNDVVAEDPLLISYCPLCVSAAAYARQIDGEPVEFGTSGMLYNSNLVMYDRKTETYWSQIDGLAIVGELSGRELTPVAVDTVSWGKWRAAHPDSEVLSLDTGFDRDYSRDPYSDYYANGYICFPVQGRDDRIQPMAIIFGIEINGVSAAYREADLIDRRVIEDRVNGVRIRISRDPSGAVSVQTMADQQTLASTRSFWFSWYAFHPDTRLYLPSG